jgi:hypothetical protein
MWSDLPNPKSPFFDQDVRRMRRQLIRQEIGSAWARVRTGFGSFAGYLRA